MQTGIFSLTKNGADASDLAIAAAATVICEEIADLDGMDEVDVEIRFAHGSGGTKISVYVQTSLDQGTSWIDLWCFTATTASKTRQRSFRPSQSGELTPTDGALADDTVASPTVLGDRLRTKVVSTGTYANSVLAARAGVRA
jgi:hypothetical protein